MTTMDERITDSTSSNGNEPRSRGTDVPVAKRQRFPFADRMAIMLVRHHHMKRHIAEECQSVCHLPYTGPKTMEKSALPLWQSNVLGSTDTPAYYCVLVSTATWFELKVWAIASKYMN